jgi:hypothetical protein
MLYSELKRSIILSNNKEWKKLVIYLNKR